MKEKEELKHDFFQIIPPTTLFNIFQYSKVKEIANLVQCSHFFSDNYYLTQRLERAKAFHLSHSELKLAFDVLVRRTFSLSADFSKLDGREKNILLEESPCADVESVSPLILDQGRANSYIPSQKYDISVFKDLYHREALMLEKTNFCLVTLSGVFKTRHESTRAIVFDPSLLALVRLYLRQRGLDPDYYIINSRITFLKNDEESLPMISVHDSEVNQFLHELGTFGALPTRDWQVKAYKAKNFSDLNDLRKWYLDVIKYLTGFPLNEPVLSTPLSLPLSFNAKKTEILEFLYDLSSNFSSDIEQEQRHFYCKVIINLLEALNINEAELDRQQQVQVLLSLQRLETLLQPVKSYTYTNFLRSVEASIDEIMILLVLQKNKIESSAQIVSDDIKQFIEETVGIRPQMATLRSSAMQAINTALLGCLTFFEQQKQQRSAIYLQVSKAAYFEIFSTLVFLFNIDEDEAEVDTGLKITSRKNLFFGNSLQLSEEKIYDFYIGNFESNLRMEEKELIFTNINAFIANQFLLRKSQNCPDRPLIIIIDNTMSDFNEVYIPYLLQQFEHEIIQGQLAILITHSGNKYIHLGTDKGLAAFLYGYYNQERLACLDKEFQKEIGKNKLGSFSPNDPTILLTQAIIKNNKNEILAYSAMIRWRTANLFKNMPKSLLNDTNYYIVDSPYFAATEEEVTLYGRINNAGFINIRINSKAFLGSENTVHAKILQDLLNLLAVMSIHPRDGFSFSQTTYVDIRRLEGTFPHNIRISIGTESMEVLRKKFNFLSNYLLLINVTMNKFRLDKCSDTIKDLTEQISEDIISSTIKFMADQSQEKLTYLSKSKHSFFPEKDIITSPSSEKKSMAMNGL